MNDAVLKALKIVVERAVEHVRATFARKQGMREELLAHLMAIFDEEAVRLGDEEAALERAKQRFGDPGELTMQLQQAVPRWDRCRSILENLGYQTSESAWHLAAKHFLMMLLIYSVWLPTWLLAFQPKWGIRGPVDVQHMLAVVLAGTVVSSLINVVPSVILAPLLYRIGPILTSKRWGRILLAVMSGLAVFCGLVLPAFTGAAVLVFLMTRQAVKQWRYQSAWA